LKGSFELPNVLLRSGRPSKHFEALSDRSKRRKTEQIRKEYVVEELTYATHMTMRAEGRRDAANVSKELSTYPSTATRYKKAYENQSQDERKQLSPLRALSMVVEADLSRRQYEIIRSMNK
ncbi:hypothetical protein QE152_g40634, partial [Popillia japonica]